MTEIIIIGSGELAKKFARFMKKRNIKVIAFFDDKANLPQNFDSEVELLSLNDIVKYIDDGIDLWIAKKKMFINNILCYLHGQGVDEVNLIDNDFLFCEDFQKYSRSVFLHDKVTIGYLETNIFDQCNLKCFGCTHFAGLFKKSQKIEKIAEDISLLSNIQVLNFRFVGGEPFMQKDIRKLLLLARSTLGNECKIEIVTNGILIPKLSIEVLDAIVESKIKLNISMYKDTYQIIDEIEGVLEKNVIDYCFNDDSKYNYNVINHFHTRLSKRSDNNGKVASKICYNIGCLFLRNKCIYKCPYPGLISEVSERIEGNHSISNEDRVEVSKMSWEKLKLLAQSTPFCNYCSIHEKVFEWGKGEEKVEYYFVD